MTANIFDNMPEPPRYSPKAINRNYYIWDSKKKGFYKKRNKTTAEYFKSPKAAQAFCDELNDKNKIK